MRLLNLGCGSNRPGPPWINLDSLHAQLAVGTPERTNLDCEENYVDWRIGTKPLPFDLESFDGVLASHIIEHMDAQEAVRAMADVRHILKPGGVLLVSVPDASYFRRIHEEDVRVNAERLFGEPIHEPDKTTFLEYGLMFRQHVQVLTEDSMWCLMAQSGFEGMELKLFGSGAPGTRELSEVERTLVSLLNRRKFSVEMIGVK